MRLKARAALLADLAHPLRRFAGRRRLEAARLGIVESRRISLGHFASSTLDALLIAAVASS